MTGYTLHSVTERIDDGDILYQEVVDIDSGISTENLDQKIGNIASNIFELYLKSLIKNVPWEVKKINASQIYCNNKHYYFFLKNI